MQGKVQGVWPGSDWRELESRIWVNSSSYIFFFFSFLPTTAMCSRFQAEPLKHKHSAMGCEKCWTFLSVITELFPLQKAWSILDYFGDLLSSWTQDAHHLKCWRTGKIVCSRSWCSHKSRQQKTSEVSVNLVTGAVLQWVGVFNWKSWDELTRASTAEQYHVFSPSTRRCLLLFTLGCLPQKLCFLQRGLCLQHLTHNHFCGWGPQTEG